MSNDQTTRRAEQIREATGCAWEIACKLAEDERDERPADEQGYNGWTNYATWGVALVLGNDEGTYNATRDQAEAFRAAAPDHANVPEIWTAEQAAVFTLEDWVKDYTEELCGLESETDALSKVSPTMMAHQLLHAALAEVNWREIAENLLSELDD